MTPNFKNQTPLDIAVEKNFIRSINIMLEIMDRHQENVMLNYAIDKNLCKIIKLGVDLKQYFATELPITQIKSAMFPSLHQDDSVKIYGANFVNLVNANDCYE